VVSSLGGAGCAVGTNGTLNGTYTVGQAVTAANTMTLYANVTQIGTWNIATTANNGVTFSGSGTFTTTGCQPITLNASGTPTTAGPLIAITNTSPQGSAAATVQPSGNASTNGTAVVTNYGNSTCAAGTAGTINGTLTQGVAVSGVTMSLYANVTQIGSWSLSASQNGVTFTGSGTFTTTGCQLITLTGAGTPTNTGSTTFTTNSTPSGSATSTVVAAFNPAQFTRAAVGNLSGKTCFDIARSNDNANSCGALSARNVNKSDFTLSSVNTQTYTFTPSGTVSNVRFQYVNTNGQVITGISGGNAGSNITTAVTASVSYNSNLNSLALGLTSSNPLSADIYVIFNDGTSDKTLKLTAYVKDCACCGAYVAAGVFKEFLCHNLGANISLDPNVGNIGLIGAYMQWGKRGPNTTGDSRFDWQTAANDGALGFVAAPTTTNANTAAVAGWNQTNPSANAWNSGTETAAIKTSNDPCPAGYRVPTLTEWKGVVANNTAITVGTWSNSSTPIYNSMKQFGPSLSTPSLSLPAAGYRAQNDGRALLNFDQGAQYLSSTAVAGNQTGSDYYVGLLGFNQTTVNTSPDAFLFGYRTQAYTVRCIAE
jgi:hypothetical protein